MKFRPLHDRVVVRRVTEEQKTAVGPGARNEKGEIVPLDVKAGDRVLFGKWSGTETKIDGEELLIMKESDIMAIIEGGAEAKAKGKKAA
jgi:chaperonin GroES